MAKHTKNINARKAQFNEVKIIDFLIKFSNCSPLNSVEPDNFTETLAFLSAVQMHEETDRAFKMAELIYNYCRNDLNWRVIESIMWCANPKKVKNDVLDLYCTHGNPSDIVLIAPNNNYLGVSLKNYNSKSRVNHKATASSVFGLTEEQVTTKTDAYNNIKKLITGGSITSRDFMDKVIHINDLPYIEVIGSGDYHRTEVELKHPIESLNKFQIHFNDFSEKIEFTVEQHNGLIKGEVNFKNSRKKNAVPRYNMLTFILE